jgi:hypothetical protein
MVYLRSEDHLQRWLNAHSWEPGATLSAPLLNDLSRAWWWTRLSPSWRPRSVGESQAILDELGLTGDFWALG